MAKSQVKYRHLRIFFNSRKTNNVKIDVLENVRKKILNMFHLPFTLVRLYELLPMYVPTSNILEIVLE